MERYFVAIANGPKGGINPFPPEPNSGIGNAQHPATRERAMEWASQHLANTPNCSRVTIYQAVAVVEREVPQIKVTDLLTKDTPEERKAA